MSYLENTVISPTMPVRSLSGGLPKTTGTVYVIIQLEQDGDSDDGKYWDTNAGGSWQASPTTWPTATHQTNGGWLFALPAAATTSRAGAKLHWWMTDNQATPASEAAVSAPLTILVEKPVEDAVWDEVISTSAHNGANSAGKRLRTLASPIVHSGTAVSATSSTIVLDAGASAVNGAYDPALVIIEGGTGAGQSRLILEYNGTTKTCYVDRDWKVNPDATSEFVIEAVIGREHVNEGKAQGGSSTTITLNSLGSAANNAYNGQVVFIRAGTGADQARRITAYDGATKVATVDHPWATSPDATSVYVMLPTSVFNSHEFQRISDMIEHQRGHHTVQGDTYYVDPVNGNDTFPGTRSRPRATVQSVHDNLVTDSAHDLIVLISGAAAGPTTLTENVTLTKRYLQIRGPGRDFIWTRSGPGDTITISGDGIGLSGFRLQTAGTGNGAGVKINSGSDFTGIAHVFVENTRGDGILVDDASHTIIEDCFVEEAGQSGAGDGVKLKVTAGSVTHTTIRRTHISNSPNSGIETVGAVADTLIEDVTIHGSGAYGVSLGTGHVDTLLNRVNMGDNTSGDLNDPDGSVIDNEEYLLSQLRDEHGTGSWQTGGGLTGALSVTFHAQTAGGAAIPKAVLTVRDSGDTVTLGTLATDTDGDVDTNIDPGTYVLKGVLPGYTFASQTVVVTVAGTYNVIGVDVTTSTPSAPDACVVYGTVVEEDGTPLQNAMVTAKVKNQPDGYFKSGNIVANRNKRHSVRTDAAGYFELQLVQGAVVDFEIDQAGINIERTVPSSSTQDVSTWK